MTALKWQRVTDSDGSTIMYVAVADRDNNREPYRSYRIFPATIGVTGGGSKFYTVELWHGTSGLEKIGSVRDTAWGQDRRGEYKLADAKRAAQQHHTAHTQGGN